MKRIGYCMALMAMGVLTASPAQAVSWRSHTVQFENRENTSGMFSIDADTGDTRDYDSRTSTGTFESSYHLDDSGDFVSFRQSDLEYVLRSRPTVGRYLIYSFLNTLTPRTDDTIFPSDSYECDNCMRSRFIVSGFTKSPVPEPATWVVMLAGFVLTGLAIRKRRKPLVRAGIA